MQNFLKSLGCDCVWHFTARENVDSILEHGLLSWAKTQSCDIHVPEPGGNSRSHYKDSKKFVRVAQKPLAEKPLAEYVHLAFINDHPMLFVAQEKENRILKPAWLKIDLSVISAADVWFSTGIAYANNSRILSAEDAINEIRFDILFLDDSKVRPGKQRKWRKDLRKAEILVPDRIPPCKILSVENG